MSFAVSNPEVAATTMVDLLRARALETPDRIAYRFLRDGEVEEAALSYAALDEQARAIAAWLQEAGVAGERAILFHPPGVEFVAAFFGCLYAGVVAVPAYPPRPNRADPRIQQIVADSQARIALTTEAVRATLEPRRSQVPGLASLRWLASDVLDTGLAARWRPPALDGDALALLQYTSGSTLTPKGVMVTHGNILANSEQIDRVIRQTPDSLSVSWLPHFHDMGLIYGIIQPLYKGFPSVLMAPAAFLQRPLRWLQAMSRWGGTLSGGPNFGYDLCINRITEEERSGLDLSRWSVAFNGAEPVRASTMEGFARAFSPCGLRKEALAGAYGMAESTLMVTITHPGRGPKLFRAAGAELERNRVVPAPADDPEARTIVGCGPIPAVPRVVIVDPHLSTPCPSGEVGEIWVSGPSIAQGYWNRPEETARTFGARLARTGEGPFLRTGDLGFVSDGELFITGRLKDLIIIRGLNHYPQDIEQSVQASHPALRPGAGAAFSVEVDEEERLVIVHEVERTQRHSDLDEVVAAIRRAVTDEHEVEVHAVALIRPASIPKTSSGKIQRQGCRRAFLEGSLSILHEWRRPAAARPDSPAEAPAAAASRSESEIVGWLVARLARESGMHPDEIDLGQPFASFGVDSARALLLVGDLETWLGRRLPPIVLWNYPTVEALARHLAA
jgi:acyl-CoA synthetase (AMP-forming)/AMP-acid ligase II/acyl carrier protein